MANGTQESTQKKEIKIPQRIENHSKTNLTFDNIHTQDIGLIDTLIKYGVLEISEPNYLKLHHLFAKCKSNSNQLTKDDIKTFDDIIASASIQSLLPINFTGITSDKTSNDYFTLKILQKLKDNGVPVSIESTSEQSKVFTTNFEAKNFFDSSVQVKGSKPLLPTSSMLGLQKLLENQAISLEQVDQLISQVYMTSLEPPVVNSVVQVAGPDNESIASERKNINDLNYKLLNELYVSYGAAKKLIFENTSMTDALFRTYSYGDQYSTADAQDARKMIQCIQSIRQKTLALNDSLLSTLKTPEPVQTNENSYLENISTNTENHIKNRFGRIVNPKIFTQNKEDTKSTAQSGLRHRKQNTLLNAYKNECSDLIRTTEKTLTEPPKWKKVLANIGLAIAGLGVFYGIAVLINKKVNNQYTFFGKRPNADKLEPIKEEITKLPGSTK